jgi:hypothetical protein
MGTKEILYPRNEKLGYSCLFQEVDNIEIGKILIFNASIIKCTPSGAGVFPCNCQGEKS